MKVFILMGQSNMVGMGEVGPETTKGTLSYLCKREGKYPHLLDAAGNWAVRDDVWYVQVTVGKTQRWLQPMPKKTIGPELQFGHVMGQIHDEMVLVIKAAQGNRSLGWDFLPPGSERFTFDGRTYAGYEDSPDSWIEGQPKKEVNWYAGKQYDDCVRDVHEVLDNLPRFFPDYHDQGYEVAGFVWWQGHKDQNPAHAGRYEKNLVCLINCLRAEFKAPRAPFVLATIAFNGWKLSGEGATIADAQLAVSDKGKHPEFADNVRTVEARDFWRDAADSPRNQGYHYNRNAETYMAVGNALGRAMAELLGKQPGDLDSRRSRTGR
ncbi:MAG: sialate O-acetylesterase [Planctomycetota bacterium]